MTRSRHSRPETGSPAGTPRTERPGLAQAADAEAALAARRLVAMREHTLVSLFELSQDLSISLDLFSVADLVLFNVMGQFGTSRAALWMASEPGNTDPTLIRSHGLQRQTAKALGPVCIAPILEYFTANSRPMTVDELEPIVESSGVLLAQRAEIQLFAAIQARGEALGVVALGPRIGGEPYGPLERDALQTSLAMVGVALQNMSLYSRMLENNRRLRIANEELQNLDRLKTEFLSNVNHELRTPLTCIIAYADSLIGMKPGHPQREEFQGVVMHEAMKLQGLLENLLTFADASQNRLEVTARPTDVVPPLARYCDDRLPGVTGALREMKWRSESNSLLAVCDEKAMLRIVDALVENAVKFTPPGSCIELRASRVVVGGVQWTAIDVEDDGPGIPAEKLPTLFDAFRQGDGSWTRTVGGMGIGLAIAQRIAVAMGGRLSVTSELGKGSTFTLLLPAA